MNKTLLVCDVQNEYASYYGSNQFKDLCSTIAQAVEDGTRVILFYNDFVDYLEYENEVIDMFLNYSDIDIEDIMSIVHSLTLVQKTYGHFRSLIDAGIDDDEIVELIKFMKANYFDNMDEVVDELSRDEFEGLFGDEVTEIISDGSPFWFNEDISITLKTLRNDIVELAGGSSEQCLKEIELELRALDITHTFLDHLVY